MTDNTPIAAVTAASTIGLKDMVLAPLTSDTASGATYGELQRIAGAIEATITPNNADPDVQYADDNEYDVLYPDPEIAFKTKLADFPLAVQKMVMGNRFDNNGVLVRNSDDKPGYFAIGFKSEKTNHKYRYVWLFKVRAKPITETYATKEGTTITRQTGEIEWTAIRRTYDNNYQAIADEDENGFTPQKAATFLGSVYAPDFANCKLATLTIGSLTLSPAFDADTVSYTASTTNATDSITATASASGATVVIKNGETTVTSGSPATWVSGANTVTVTVTNGTSSRVYTIVVTKSGE